jgi:hypothetical protein
MRPPPRRPTHLAREAERGQASAEFVALLLLCCVTFGALFALRDGLDGRAFGGFLTRHFVCAVGGRCDRDELRLVRAYGERDAATVRALAPNLVYEPGERELPVDWRRCRRVSCAAAPDEPMLDAHVADGQARAGGGGRARAIAFTRLLRRDGRLYIQYWLYYPDSNTTLAGSDRLWERLALLKRVRQVLEGTPDYPGFHRDDWEAAFLRVDPDGTVWARASSHGHVQGCKWRACANRWVRSTGWVRVTRGSHSGHVPYRREPVWMNPKRTGNRRYVPLAGPPRLIPVFPGGGGLEERSTTGEGLRLVPLETLDRRRYAPLDPGVKPPWRKRAYTDPETDES